MEEMEAITIVNEDGEEFDFAVDRLLEYNGQRYAVLVPMEEEIDAADEAGVPEEEESDQEVEEGAEDLEDCAVIFRIEKEDGEEVLVDIDNDEEFQAVAEEYYKLVDEDEGEGDAE